MANTKLQIEVVVDSAGAISGLKLVEGSMKSTTDATRKAGEAADFSTGKFAAMAAAAAAGALAIKAATIDMATYAARTETLAVVTDRLAKINNLSVDAVRRQAKAVRDQGITTQESYGTINKMIFAQLDLAKATNIARLAQDAAVIAGINSSEALNGIIHGIVTRQPEVLRTYGLIVNFEQEYAKAARKLGHELTGTEKQQVAMNAVLREGAKITGAYEVSMTTAGKQLTSMPRYIDEMKNALGKGLVPALGNTVQLMSQMAQYATDNATAFTRMATGVTAAALAAGAFRFTPGPLPFRAAVAGAVGLGAYFGANQDPVTYYQQAGARALSALDKQAKALEEQVRTRRVTADQYKAQAGSLEERRGEIRRQIAEAIADVFAQDARTGDTLKGNIRTNWAEAFKRAGGISGTVGAAEIRAALESMRSGGTAGGALFNQQAFDAAQAEALAEQNATRYAGQAKARREQMERLLDSLNEQGLDPLAKLILDTTNRLREIVQANGRLSGRETGALGTALRGRIARELSGRTAETFESDRAERFDYGFLPGVAEMVQPDPQFGTDALARVRAQALAAMQRYATFQERIVQLTAGPGGEVAAIEKVAMLRESTARREFEITQDRIKLEADLDQIQKDRIIQRLELAKRERDEYIQAAGQIYDALRRGGSGLKDFFTGQFDVVGRKVFQNVAGLTFDFAKNAIPKLPGQVSSTGELTTLGRILQGTPFGTRPEDIAAGKQITAADIQLRAATTFAGAVGMVSTGGTAGVSGIGGLAGMLGPGGTAGFAGPLGKIGAGNVFGIPGLSDRSVNIPGFQTTTLSALLSGGAQAGLGAFGAVQGFRNGGLAGGLQAAGGLAGMAGGLLPMVSKSLGFLGPVGMIAGIGLSLAPLLLGDPKQKRSEAIDRMLEGARYESPESMQYMMDTSGRSFDYDYRGTARVVNITNNISAIDSRSFAETVRANGSAIAETIDDQLMTHGPLQQRVRATALPV